MNKGWFGGLLGKGQGSSGAGNSGGLNVPVEALFQKIQESTELEGKKDAVSQLISINRSCHQLVGSKMSILTTLLSENQNDIELVREIIQILTLIMTTLPKDDNIIEIHNTELFISSKENFVVITDLLKLNDYYVRYYIARFLYILIKNRFEAVQQAILSCPMSMPNIMSLLTDSRDMIRNEALLIILELTKSNQEIQKIVAFEGAFEIILGIIKKEGSSEGGVVVNDGILILNNLLKGNVSNQNFFRETRCIQELSSLLEVQNTDMWILSDNKFTIIMSTLDLILILVERNNTSTPLNQIVISQCGIMNLIIRLGLGKMSSQVIRSKSLYTLGEIIHLSNENISALSGVTMKSEITKQGQTALLRLTTVMLYSKDLIEKSAAFHVFKSYLYNNEEAQMALASTIISDSNGSLLSSPPSSQPQSPQEQQQLKHQQQLEFESLSIGQHLFKALFSWETPIAGKPFDISCFWFASVVLLYMLKDSVHTKDQLLKMPLEVPKSSAAAEKQPLTLFTKLMESLLNTKKHDIDPTIKIGLLKLLSVWLDQSPNSIQEFFKGPQNLAFLVELILSPSTVSTSSTGNPSASLQPHIQGLAALILGICAQYMNDETAEQNRSNLSSIINHRITINIFKDKLDTVRKSDQFTNAEQSEDTFDPSSSSAKTIVLYDFDYTLFFKDIYDKIRHIGTNINKPRPGKRPTNNSANTTTTTTTTQPPSQQQPPQTSSLSPPVNTSSATSSPQTSSPAIPHRHDHSQSQSQTPTQNNSQEYQQAMSELNHYKKANHDLMTQLTQVRLDSQNHSQQQQIQLQQLQQQIQLLQQQQQQQPTMKSDEKEKELLHLLEEKVREVTSLSDAVYKLEDVLCTKDEQIEELSNQLEQSKAQQQNNNNSGGSLDSSDYFELLRLRQDSEQNHSVNSSRIQSLESEVSQLNQKISQLLNENQILQQQKEDALKKIVSSPSSVISDPNSLNLAKVKGELNEMVLKYESLQKEQDELLEAYSKIELENTNLKNQLSKLQQ
ncbi:hypothetical protein DICPUDRAFT_147928 [Dictyostelium purpureum]|uniref:Vesicle tethering protein Uso1/P115-like head domain-containing protein n=1 Tax=Dictyostelium purpureum TaxID=5786 RepID=F0Z9S7_DICPU|nr:uncharacterized protein DICPUDRAFT_147928 [Dictyostelium purpureum]EGC39295.1 hypothetical protein DICPUDRAFT_147928 [Dictyostelium purpureum]|eukprot:XP_003284199.1 hypothetical protein DICPUDRAFT_147928 [Dictyostelium purpureum]